MHYFVPYRHPERSEGSLANARMLLFAILSMVGVLTAVRPVYAVLICETNTIKSGVFCDGLAGKSWCGNNGNTCAVEPVYTPEVNSAFGSSLNCNTCAPACPSSQPVACIGNTISAATNFNASCQASEAGTQCNADADAALDGVTDACGSCTCPNDATHILCGSDCKAPAPAVNCPTGTTFNNCTGACDSPYVLISPTTAQSGFFNVTGSSRIGTDLTVGTDLYLNSGQKILVDTPGSSSLTIGNYKFHPSIVNQRGTDFHLTLHAAAGALADLILQQGTADRWALSVRPGAPATAFGADFEIRRGVENWPRVLAIDYNTGNVTIDTNLEITGTLTAGGAAVLTQPAQCGNGQVLQWNGITWICATPSTAPTYTAGDYLTIGADNKISATHSGNCFGPVFQGVDANAPSSGGVGGYIGANARCASYGAGAHVCSTAEVLESIRCTAVPSGPQTAPIFTQTGFAWISNGPPGFTANANDCLGWTDGTGVLDGQPTYGAVWNFSPQGGIGWLTSCASPNRFACCR